MSNFTVSRVEPSIDWLTVTAVDGGKRNGLWYLGRELLKKSEAEGNFRRPWHWKSYGGHHCGWATVGDRDDSTILQLSGRAADDWYEAVYLVTDHTTRLDLAVTCWVGEKDGNLADEHLSEALRWKEEQHRPLGIKAIADNGRTNTVYFGARTSDLCGRIYDKALESGDDHWRLAWRYELEAKGDVACRTSRALYSGGNRPHRIANLVHNYFQRRGCAVIFDGDDPSMQLQLHRASSDSLSRLAWLEQSARPAVQRLLRNGHAADVLEALGLPTSFTEWSRFFDGQNNGNHKDELQEGWTDETD